MSDRAGANARPPSRQTGPNVGGCESQPKAELTVLLKLSPCRSISLLVFLRSHRAYYEFREGGDVQKGGTAVAAAAGGSHGETSREEEDAAVMRKEAVGRAEPTPPPQPRTTDMKEGGRNRS